MSIGRVAVVGAGVMGSGIAQVFATAGLDTRCVDESTDALERARYRIEKGRYGLVRGVERGRLTPEQADVARSRLHLVPDLRGAVSGADLVIECIPEDLAAKTSLFETLGRVTPHTTLLASNSSGLPITALAAASGRPESVLGWHWASPPVVQRLAEIVVTETTAPACVDLVVGLAKACGKNPVVVRDVGGPWGYAANRVYLAMVAEARRAVADGVVDETGLDTLMRDAYGWPAGPFELLRSAADGWGDDGHSSIADWHGPEAG